MTWRKLDPLGMHPDTLNVLVQHCDGVPLLNVPCPQQPFQRSEAGHLTGARFIHTQITTTGFSVFFFCSLCLACFLLEMSCMVRAPLYLTAFYGLAKTLFSNIISIFNHVFEGFFIIMEWFLNVSSPAFAADPLVGSIATQYLTNRAEHDRIARQWTKRYAT